MSALNIGLNQDSSLEAATSYISTSLQDAVKLRIGEQGIWSEKPQTIPQHFHECCIKYSNKPALTFNNLVKSDSNLPTTTITYSEYEETVHQTALMLLHVGLQPRSSVGILSFNCPEWFYAEFGAMKSGGVVAGIYPSNSAEAVFHVLDTSEATVCVVDDAHQMAKVKSIKSRLPRLRAVIQIHGPFEDFVGIDEGYYRWEDLYKMEFGLELVEELQRREQNIKANECALLIYTSGTVGMPKGVMLSHDAIVINTKSICRYLGDIQEGSESCVTYLPLNHIAAQIFDIFMMIESGGCVNFADRNALKGTLPKTLATVRPTRFFGVPRVFEKIQEALITHSANSTKLQKLIFNKSRRIVEAYHLQSSKTKPSFLTFWLASKIMHRIHVALGLDKINFLIVGGAPVSEELKRFYISLNLPLCEAYGLSESGGICINLVPQCIDSAGKTIDGVELKIFNPDSNGYGEVCIRGRTCLMGYLKDLEKTNEALREDGWFHTGDIGYLDSEGNLVMSGRIKELIITSGGENIPPVQIEEQIKRELPFISNAMVVGDHRKYLSVLVTLKTEMDSNTGMPLDDLRPEVVEWLNTLDLNCTLLSEVLNIPSNLSGLDASNVVVAPNSKLVDSVEDGIKRANCDAISNAQKVQKFAILPHDFSIPTGELGPTLKVRRNIVLQKYANVIDSMYK